MAAQSYASHRQVVPGFHLGVFAGLTINLGWAIYRLGQTRASNEFVGLVLAASLIGLFIYTRSFPLKVQDRLIRLEMLVRLRDALPAALQPRIREFSLGQLIALRFAGDEELPALAEKVLVGNIQDRNAIKKMVTDWQADHHRV